MKTGREVNGGGGKDLQGGLPRNLSLELRGEDEINLRLRNQ